MIINTNVSHQAKQTAYYINHSPSDRRTIAQLEEEGRAFARERQLGECLIVAHQSAAGDHVHVVVKE